MLTGIISQNGELFIRRGTLPVSQYCCYNKTRPCSDRCPLFGDPEPVGPITQLELCQAVLQFKELSDNREPYEEEHKSYGEKE